MAIDTGIGLSYISNYPVPGGSQSTQQFRDNFYIVQRAIEAIQSPLTSSSNVLQYNQSLLSTGEIRVDLTFKDNAFIIPFGSPSIAPGVGMVRTNGGLFQYHNGLEWLNVSAASVSGALTIPKGTDAQRPSEPVEGVIRYNTEIKSIELFDGEDWIVNGIEEATLEAIDNAVVSFQSNVSLVESNITNIAVDAEQVISLLVSNAATLIENGIESIETLTANSLAALEAEAGTPGPSVELQVSVTHVQWRVVGDEDWIDLIPLSSLEGESIQGDPGEPGEPGEPGQPGPSVEFQTTETHIQWRVVGDEAWINLAPKTDFGLDEEAVEEKVVNVNLKRYVAVSDYAPVGSDASAGIVAALAAGVGREVVFDVPTGSSERAYVIDSRAGGNIVIPHRSHLIMEPGAFLDARTWSTTSGTGVALLRIDGTQGSEYSLMANAVKGESAFELGAANISAMGLQPGDEVNIFSDDLWMSGSNPTTTFRGELKYVQAISGDDVLVAGVLADSYTVAHNARVSKVNRHSVRMENMSGKGPGAFVEAVGSGGSLGLGDTFLRASNALINSQYGEIELFDFHHYSVTNSRGSFRDIISRKGENVLGRNQYHFCYNNACQDIIYDHLRCTMGKHGVVQSGTGSPRGITRNVDITFCHIEGTWANPLATHENAEDIYYGENFMRGSAGMEIGCRRMRTFKNVVDLGTSTGNGIIITVDPEDIILDGDEIRGGWFGYVLNLSSLPPIEGTFGPAKIEIRNGLVTGCAQKGLAFNYSGDTTDRFDVEVSNLKTRSIGGVSVEVIGPFKRIKLADLDLQGASGGFAAINTSGISDAEIQNVRWLNHNTPVLAGSRIRKSNLAPHQLTTVTEFIIASNGFLPTPVEDTYIVSSNSGITDDLQYIGAGAPGQKLTLIAKDGHTITVIHGTSGNTISTPSGTNQVLKCAVMICDGARWHMLAGGNSFTELIGSKTQNWGNLAASGGASWTTVTVPGAVVGDSVVDVWMDVVLASGGAPRCILSGVVSADNTVDVLAVNHTSSAAFDPLSGTLYVRVRKET